MVKLGIGLVLAAFVFLPACGGSDDETPEETSDSIEIGGTWISVFGGTETIDDESWTSESPGGSYPSEIVEFSNADNAAVLLAGDGTYGRNVWTTPSDEGFHYCTVSYGKDSVEAAIDESVIADESDLDASGCNAFPWTQLTRE